MAANPRANGSSQVHSRRSELQLQLEASHDPIKNGFEGDSQDVADMGYVVQIHDRKFTVLSVFAIGFSICNSAVAVIVSLATGLGSGGPITYVYSQIFVYLVSVCVALSLGELASAFPNAGGQYYWASQLAPARLRKTVSYVVGFISWIASVFTAASVTLVVPQQIIGLLILTDGVAVSKPWMVWVGFQAANLFVFGANCFERFLPSIGRAVLLFSVSTVIVVFVSLLASAPIYQSASFVFTDFVNESGWNSKGVALLTGVLGVNWGFSCLDAVTHMAEEIPNPRRNVPKALLGTVVVGICTAFPLSLAILFCIQDIDAVISTRTLVPSIELFNQVFSGNKKAVIGLQSLLTISNIGSLWGVHTWQSRLAWSFARDHGLPFSRYISKIAGAPYDVPLFAHAWSCFWVGVLGCLYLGSTVAFNSFVGGAIIMQYLSYSTCIILLLSYGRNKFHHGPFWLKRFGVIANFVTIGWTVVTTIFYCFPPYLPVATDTMNYISVVVVGILSLVTLYYVLFARKIYAAPVQVDMERIM